MTISSEEASAMLAGVDAVVARMKQSQIYRSAGDIFILWGALQAVRDIDVPPVPQNYGDRLVLRSTSSASC